jgi:adenylosuccinate lyase
VAALEDVALWHERDISHSSGERVIGPDATIALDFMLSRFTNMMDKLVVYPERMMANLNMTHGIIFSQMVLLALVEKADARSLLCDRAEARHAILDGRVGIQRAAGKRRRGEKYLSKKDLAAIFNLKNFLNHLDFIFERVFKAKF